MAKEKLGHMTEASAIAQQSKSTKCQLHSMDCIESQQTLEAILLTILVPYLYLKTCRRGKEQGYVHACVLESRSIITADGW